MRSWLVQLLVVALMALCQGSAMAGSHGMGLAGEPGATSAGPAAGALEPCSTLSGAEPDFQPGSPAEPAGSPLPLADTGPLDTAADVPALVDGPRPFPLPELQAAAPRRLIGAPPPLPFLEGLRRPPRGEALAG